MSALELLLLAAAGGLGAGARYVLDIVLSRGREEAFPIGIFVVNVTGSFLLGIVTGLGSALSDSWLAIVGVGLLGGYTTFSTVSVDSVLLARRGRRDWAWLNLVGTFLVCAVAAAIGLMIGGFFPR